MVQRWLPVWNRRVHGAELEVWQQRLRRHQLEAVEAVLGDLLDAGISAPKLAELLGRLNGKTTPRVAPYEPLDEWQGPTARGRAFIAKAKAEVAGAYRWDHYRPDVA